MAAIMKVQRRTHSRLLTLLLVFAGFAVYSTFVVQVADTDNVDDSLRAPDAHAYSGRHLLMEHGEEPGNCTVRSIDEFHGDFLTPETRRKGGVVVHILITLYIFASLAIICDDYFVSSLEKICLVLKLKPDVAGATFMAGGSSAPELFTSIVGVFFAKSDVGVGTIVGSAVFNILFIVAICGLFAGCVTHLSPWPLVRDCMYYMMSVIILIVVIHDETVHWYEALIMLVMYGGYILIMYFNQNLEKLFNNRFAKKDSTTLSVDENKNSEKDSEKKEPLDDDDERSPSLGNLASDDVKVTIENGKEMEAAKDKEDDDGYESPLTFPDKWLARIQWIIMLPMTILFMLTVPDCRREGCWRKLYVATFAMSIVWIAALSYVMVWIVTIIGDTVGIPDTVMGLTFLAAGTSVPDALASLFVARDGFGDMAVSNSIGSNVFDILLCLGLPWLIQTGMIKPNSIVSIHSGGLTFCAITLLGTVFFMLISVRMNRWKLDRKHGLACLLVYAVFLLFSIMYEMNVFSQVNPPPCPRATYW